MGTDPSLPPGGTPVVPGLDADGRIAVLGTEDAGPAAVRGGIVRIVGYVVGIALSVVAAALLFRHLGVDDGGRYITVFSLIGIVGGVSDLGLSALAMRELSVRDTEGRRDLLRDLMGLRIATTLVGGGGGVLFVVISGYGRTSELGALIATGGLLIQSVQAMLTTPMLARLQLGLVTAIDLLRQLVMTGGTILLVVLDAPLLAFFAVPGAGALAALVATVPFVRADVPAGASFDRRRLGALLKPTLTLALATAIGSIYFRVAVIVTSLVGTADETGYFGVSFRVVEVLAAIPALAIGSAFPIFTRAASEDYDRLAYGVSKTYEVSLALGGLLAIGIGSGAVTAIDIVAGSDFAPSVGVLRIQGVALGLACVAGLWAYVMVSMHRNRELVAFAGGMLLISAGLTAALVPSAGAQGGAIATLIAEFAAVIGGAVVLGRVDARLRPRLLPALRVLGALAAGAAVMAIPGQPELVRAIGATGVYLVALGLLGGYPEELLQELRRRKPVPA